MTLEIVEQKCVDYLEQTDDPEVRVSVLLEHLHEDPDCADIQEPELIEFLKHRELFTIGRSPADDTEFADVLTPAELDAALRSPPRLDAAFARLRMVPTVMLESRTTERDRQRRKELKRAGKKFFSESAKLAAELAKAGIPMIPSLLLPPAVTELSGHIMRDLDKLINILSRAMTASGRRGESLKTRTLMQALARAKEIKARMAALIECSDDPS